MATKTIVAKPQGGFTLLELIVAIVILALIVTIAYSALRVGSKTWESTAKTITENSTARFAVQFIRRKVEQIYPMNWGEGKSRSIAFLGNEDGVRFIAPAPQGRETLEYYEYYLATIKTDSDTALMLYYEPHDPSTDKFKVDKSSPYREILTHLESVQFRYFGKADKTKDAEWVESWNDDSAGFPSLLEIGTVGIKGQSPTLDLIMEIRSQQRISN